MPRPKLNRLRINVTLPPDLIKRVDARAAAEGRTRSDVLEEAAGQYLEKRGLRPKKGK